MSKDYHQKIKREVLDKAHQEWDELSKEKQIVIGILVDSFMKRKITQQEIVDFPEWEEKPTKRTVREIIRQLRVDHQYPIISDSKGYTFPRDKKEAQEYIDRLEHTVREAATSHYETYGAMKKALGMENEFFEQLDLDLFK
jgi:phosphopantetheine adenylyltransferase